MGTIAALYNECIKNCELVEIFTAKIYGEVFSRTKPTKNSEMQISVDPSAIRVDDNTVHTTLSAKIDGFKSAKANKASWNIEVKVVAVFSIDEQHLTSEDDLNLFANRQGVLTLMPYLRSEVSSLSSNIGLGAITLPLIKFFPTLSENLESIGD